MQQHAAWPNYSRTESWREVKPEGERKQAAQSLLVRARERKKQLAAAERKKQQQQLWQQAVTSEAGKSSRKEGAPSIMWPGSQASLPPSWPGLLTSLTFSLPKIMQTPWKRLLSLAAHVPYRRVPGEKKTDVIWPQAAGGGRQKRAGMGRGRLGCSLHYLSWESLVGREKEAGKAEKNRVLPDLPMGVYFWTLCCVWRRDRKEEEKLSPPAIIPF